MMNHTGKLLASTMIAAACGRDSADAQRDGRRRTCGTGPAGESRSPTPHPAVERAGRRAAADPEHRVGHIRRAAAAAHTGSACPGRHGVADAAAGAGASGGRHTGRRSGDAPRPPRPTCCRRCYRSFRDHLPTRQAWPSCSRAAFRCRVSAPRPPEPPPRHPCAPPARDGTHRRRCTRCRRTRGSSRPTGGGRPGARVGSQRAAVTPARHPHTIEPWENHVTDHEAVRQRRRRGRLVGGTAVGHDRYRHTPNRPHRCRSMPCRRRACRRWRASARRFRRRPPIRTTRRRC